MGGPKRRFFFLVVSAVAVGGVLTQVANPTGVNGPRQRMTHGRLRNTVVNIGSKTAYPTTVAPRPIPNTTKPGVPTPLPYTGPKVSDPTAGATNLLRPFDPAGTMPNEALLAQMRTLQSSTAAMAAMAQMRARFAQLLAQMQAAQQKAGVPGGPFPAKVGRLVYGQKNPYYFARATGLWKSVDNLFPGVSFGGIHYPGGRNIRGTNKPSEHSYGAAIDIMVPNSKVGMRVYRWLMANRRQFGFRNVLYDPAGRPGHNRGDHINHIHVGWLY